MSTPFTTITGRRIDLSTLTCEEHSFLGEIGVLYRQNPDWNEFSRSWIALARQRLWKDGVIPVGHPVYRVCQDLESRLGISQGYVARPDYRDQLAELIEEKYGSRYQSCREAGIDQGHLSRVLAGQKHLSMESLFSVLDALGVEVAFIDRGETERRLRERLRETPLDAGRGHGPTGARRRPDDDGSPLTGESSEYADAAAAIIRSARHSEELGAKFV